MLDVLPRVLAGCMALSCAGVVDWSVVVTRYEEAMDRRPPEPWAGLGA